MKLLLPASHLPNQLQNSRASLESVCVCVCVCVHVCVCLSVNVHVCRCVLRVRPCTPVLHGAPPRLQKISRVTFRTPGSHSTACDKHGLLNINRMLQNAPEMPTDTGHPW